MNLTQVHRRRVFKMPPAGMLLFPTFSPKIVAILSHFLRDISNPNKGYSTQIDTFIIPRGTIICPEAAEQIQYILNSALLLVRLQSHQSIMAADLRIPPMYLNWEYSSFLRNPLMEDSSKNPLHSHSNALAESANLQQADVGVTVA